MKANKKFLTGVILVFTLMVCLAFGASAIEESGSLGENVTYTYDSATGEVVISGIGNMKNYSDIGASTVTPFYDSDIKSVTIEDGVTSIGAYAFYTCKSLTSIKIPDSVISIGEGAFADCNSLTSVTIPESVTSISSRLFYNCTLTSITIPESVTSIGGEAFFMCGNLTSVVIPDSVTSIGMGAFKECVSLEDVTISDSVTSIRSETFANCYALTSITIPESVTSIGDEAFFMCSKLTSVVIPDSVTSIGEKAFYPGRYLTNAHYCGTQTKWNETEVANGNAKLTNVIHMSTDKNNDGICDLCDFVIFQHIHSYTEYVQSSNCTSQGYTAYICICGDSYISDYTEAIGHKDSNGDYICDNGCGYEFEQPDVPDIPDTPDCTCNCHKTGFSGFIWKILRIFYKLFKTNPVCTCGVAHY